MPAAGDDLGCSSRRAETLSYALRECIGYVVWVRSCTGSQTKDSSVAVRSRFRYLREVRPAGSLSGLVLRSALMSRRNHGGPRFVTGR